MGAIFVIFLALIGGALFFRGIGRFIAEFWGLKARTQRIIGPHESTRFPHIISRRSRMRWLAEPV